MEEQVLGKEDDNSGLRQRKVVTPRPPEYVASTKSRPDYLRIGLVLMCGIITAYALYKVAGGVAHVIYIKSQPRLAWEFVSGLWAARWSPMQLLTKKCPEMPFKAALSQGKDGGEKFLSILVGVKDSGASAVSYVQKEILIPLTGDGS